MIAAVMRCLLHITSGVSGEYGENPPHVGGSSGKAMLLRSEESKQSFIFVGYGGLFDWGLSDMVPSRNIKDF